MRKRWVSKFAAVSLVGAMALSTVGCGSSASAQKSDSADGTTTKGSDSSIASDSPYKGKGFDLSKKETITMYMVGDKPADMDKVLAKANSDYFEPNLNTTLDLEFLNWSDYKTKYSLLLSGGENVDLIYTASWCYYNEEQKAGAFKKLSTDFLKKYLPNSYALQPAESWNEIAINGDIYAVPKAKASFTGYSIVAVRQDLIDKYNLTKPDSWDNYMQYLKELADIKKDTGVTPLNTNANREQLLGEYLQNKTIQSLTDGYDWYYVSNNKEDAPAADDVFYLYTSDQYKDYCLQMADLAKEGAWSTDAINDTSDAQAYFENGTSGSFIWNSSVFQAGKNLETANKGTYSVYDITPTRKRAKSSYASDAIAITQKSKDPKRAALVLDYMKSDVNLNRLLLGGIKGEHWDLDANGNRTVLDASTNYTWDNWAWAINRSDEPDQAGLDAREVAINQANASMEYVPKQTGFTFDPSKVQTQYTAVKAVVDEYSQSFALGIYGDKTSSTFDTFKKQLKDAGIDDVTKEILSQYNTYKKNNKL